SSFSSFSRAGVTGVLLQDEICYGSFFLYGTTGKVGIFLVISSRAKKIIEQIIANVEKPGLIKYVPNPNPI
ncbi:hypothetical protein, partial [Peribacillus simplex]|uniref:hypothetical protein n=1 Tax=Peribacillus simplex TaxID=1478 RepID=UPI003D2D067A